MDNIMIELIKSCKTNNSNCNVEYIKCLELQYMICLKTVHIWNTLEKTNHSLSYSRDTRLIPCGKIINEYLSSKK